MQQDRDKIQELKDRLEALKRALDFDGKKKRIGELEKESSQPGFWEDREKATELMKEMGSTESEVREIDSLDRKLDNTETLKNTEALKRIETVIRSLELKIYLGDEYDQNEAILAIHAGQGGTEAMDWAQMLERMYIKYCDRKGWKYKIADQIVGEEAGIKSTTMTIDGSYAYGYLKGEAGVHRLVRQSPFNADKLRQTSFALVEVLPQIQQATEVEIKDDDLEWEFFRASTQGGQNVQKVSSAVRLRHKPSGIIVTSQTQRYQEQNRKIALGLLKSRLWALEQEKIRRQREKLKGEYKVASWGNQIRSYVLHPYKMVKDLRTGVESKEPDKILAGELDNFIEAEIKMV